MTDKTTLERARLALEGLSVGDGFGEKFFMHTDRALSLILGRALPKPVWSYTDDTNMALSIYESREGHPSDRPDARQRVADFRAGYRPVHALVRG